jgi:hypothetical protein
MSAPIWFFLQQYKNGKYSEITPLLQQMGINTTHVLENSLIELKKIKSPDPLLSEFIKEGYDEIYFMGHTISKLYDQQQIIRQDPILSKEADKSLDIEPADAKWALQLSPWKDAPRVLKKLMEEEKIQGKSLITGTKITYYGNKNHLSYVTYRRL